MPPINIFYHKEEDFHRLDSHIPEIKAYFAEALSCGDIALTPKEISIRLISVKGKMIGEIEAEITAYAFTERVKKQDEICCDAEKYLKELTSLDAKVWLKLSELGYSG